MLHAQTGPCLACKHAARLSPAATLFLHMRDPIPFPSTSCLHCLSHTANMGTPATCHFSCSFDHGFCSSHLHHAAPSFLLARRCLPHAAAVSAPSHRRTKRQTDWSPPSIAHLHAFGAFSSHHRPRDANHTLHLVVQSIVAPATLPSHATAM